MKNITTDFHKVHYGYCLYSHGVIHYKKAKIIFKGRGWGKGQGNRLTRKKLCNGTYLHYDEEADQYYITYWGSRIVSILPNYQWIVHKTGHGGCNEHGYRYRVAHFVPVNIYSHQYTLYLGHPSRPLYKDTTVSLHDQYAYPYTWHNWARWEDNRDQRNTPSSRERFSRTLDSYLYCYFSAWMEYSWREIISEEELDVRIPVAQHSNFTMTDKLVSSGSPDKYGYWLENAHKTGPVNGSIMQAMAYLCKYSFLELHDYDNITYSDPDDEGYRTLQDRTIKENAYPSFLDDLASVKSFPAVHNSYGYYHNRSPMPEFHQEWRYFAAARAALQDLWHLIEESYHSSMFHKRRQALAVRPEDGETAQARSYRTNNRISFRDKVRVTPYDHNSSDENRYEDVNATNNHDAKKYIAMDKFVGEHNAYYPRTILLSIIRYLSLSGELPEKYLDNLCETCFTQAKEKHKYNFVAENIGHPDSPDNVADVLDKSHFGPLYFLVKKFFMDRIHYFDPVLGHSNTNVAIEEHWFRNNGTSTKDIYEGLNSRPLVCDVARLNS